MNNMTFSLDGHTPVEETDVTKWAEWFERSDAERRVGYERIGETTVSTVFMGVNNNWQAEGPPILFETMAFGPKRDANILMGRYSTWEEAEAGHAAVVNAVKAGDG